MGRVHGHYGTPTYKVWIQLRRRVRERPDYQKLGMAKRWDSFENFLVDMGERPVGKTLDRINTHKGYFPSNCRWATVIEQAYNKKNTRWVTFQGQRKHAFEWATHFGLKRQTVLQRLYIYGWSPRKAFTTPVRYRRDYHG